MQIKRGDLVLEVGSGNNPYPRSDVLLDKYLFNSKERENNKKLVIDRPLVIGEVEHLPFRNKSFDYVIASHVLEHADNPSKFLDEISRVGKSGYIATPLPLQERVFNWPIHRWYVYNQGHKLLVIKKTKKSRQFHYGITKDKLKNHYILTGITPHNLSFEWRGRIHYQVLNEEPNDFLYQLDYILMQRLPNVKIWQDYYSRFHTIQWLKNALFPIKLKILRAVEALNRQNNIDLLSLIVCPYCKNDLKVNNYTLHCTSCKLICPYKFKRIPCFTKSKKLR